ncbi:MAG: diguanylate cyclase [Campylobacter sp.]|nr:diguanylate cyclase [Campylobacter sp.]
MINREEFLTNILKYATMIDKHENIIDNVLEYLAKTLEADRSYIFEEIDGKYFNNTYEWCNKGVSPQKDNLQNVPYEVCELWYKEYDANKTLIIYDMDEYKNVAPKMHAYLEPQGIRTLVTGPLELNGKYIGFYGVDNPPVHNMEDVAAILSTLSYVLSIMIANRDALNKIQKMTFIDQLTGVKNRHAFDLIKKSFDPQETSINIMMCDINGLKVANDTKGHKAGDKLILDSANALSRVFGKDNVYRMGGDEFVVFVKGKSEDEFNEMIAKLQAFLDSCDIHLAMGYVHNNSDKFSISKMLREADSKMYEDKRKFYSKSKKHQR